MSRLGINTGNTQNDGQGDPLRVAMGKINSNFQEVYNTIGDGNTLISYASTAGISTLAQNLTGNPIINVSGVLNTGITTTEHIQVRNITSIGVITATQFVGDGSQLTNVTASVGGLEVLDDNVRLGVARELNFGANIISSGPDGVGRVTISVPSTIYFDTQYSSTVYAVTAGISTISEGLTGTPNISVGVVTASRLNVTGVGTFISSGLKIRNPANTFQYNITGGAIAADRTLNLPVITGTDTVATLGLSQTFSTLQTFSAGLTVSAGTLTVSGGTITAGNVAAILLGGNTTTNISFASGQTTGTLTIGAVSQTGTLTVGLTTASQTTNIQAGANASTTLKTINFGTGGVTGSRTLITVGPGPSAGIGTVVINSGNNLLVGTATSTGTSLQPLQVTGGAYVSGNLGVGNTNPSYNIDVTGSVGIATTSGDALLLSSTLSNGRTSIVLNTNGNDWELGSRGSGASPINSFYIYDRNASAYRQVIDPSGNVLLGGATATTGTSLQPLQVTGGAYVSGNLGIGITNPSYKAEIYDNVNSSSNSLRVSNASTGSSAYSIINVSTGGVNAYWFTNSPNRTVDGGTNTSTIRNDNGDLRIQSLAGVGIRIKGTSGNVLIGTETETGTASQTLQVTGGAYVSGGLGVGVTNNTTAGSIAVSNQIISTQANNTADGGGQIYLNGATGNRIDFNQNGVAAPSFTTRSVGTKLVLYPTSTPTVAVDWALGIDNLTLWSSVSDSTAQFKWYAGITNIASLFGTGELVLGTTTKTGTASQPLQVSGGAYVSGSVGIGTTNPSSKLSVVGSFTATDTRIQSVGEKTTVVNGNTISLVYNTGGGNIAICTNPSGDIGLNITGIPTDSSFNNYSLTFSVIVSNTGTARSCTTVNLNGVSTTIKWFGGSLAAAISGVTTTTGYDIYNFTGINTVGSASTAANYIVFGSVNGGYR